MLSTRYDTVTALLWWLACSERCSLQKEVCVVLVKYVHERKRLPKKSTPTVRADVLSLRDKSSSVVRKPRDRDIPSKCSNIDHVIVWGTKGTTSTHTILIPVATRGENINKMQSKNTSSLRTTQTKKINHLLHIFLIMGRSYTHVLYPACRNENQIILC